MGQIRIGISGWTYDPWIGDFYPEELAKKRRLEYASRRLNSIEINGSFYSLQRPGTYRAWYERTPDDFLFAVKGSRFITHNKKLGDAETPLANFFASGVLRLEEKLGPILWQLPANLAFDEERAESFFELLPRNTEEMAALGRKHDDRVEGRSWTKTDGRRRVRHAVEFRHESWLCAEAVRTARRHGVAFAFADSGKWPYNEELTAGFVYLRLHGSPDTYRSNYGDARLDGYAEKIRSWADGGEPEDAERVTDRVPPRRKSRDVYVYFDNDAELHAPWYALGLAARVGSEGDRGADPEGVRN
ncbi:MAG: DUF72 domain-containing protein, partial [Gemmatimonadetes bacterium]|nr:DUF72 domain-containing protein [Gemmatimonadota bacterium]